MVRQGPGKRGRVNPVDKLELGLTEETSIPDTVISNRLTSGVSTYKNLRRWRKQAEERALIEEDGVADPLLELSWNAPKNKHLALLFYFFKLADNPNTIASFEYVDQLIEAGADVNAQDRAGQTLLHEVSRDWGADVAQYLITKGALVNTPDCQGRSPLHIACRTENVAVTRCLLSNGAASEALTTGEIQTPLHYAARHDASQAIEVLLEFSVELNPRDYKGRTPLLLAAELDRSVAASKLLEAGAKAGVIDKTGLHTLCAMVEKMPGVANTALDQFHVTNRGSRQQFFFLNYLEPDPDIDELSFLGMSVLGSIVSSREIKLMNHPVIREMIQVKWRSYGRSRCLINLLVYGVYLLAWTCVVFVYQPWRLEQGATSSTTDVANIVSVSIAVLIFLYLLIEEFRDLYRSEISHFQYKQWRSKQIERDLQYVPEKMTEERDYLLNQAKTIRDSSSSYSKDPWNWFDWLSYVMMLGTSICVLICLYATGLSEKHKHGYILFALWTSRMMCLTIIIIWLKLFKYVRVYSFLGPFVVILANTLRDIIKIAFVFVVFFVPTVAVFYHFYYNPGGDSFKGLRETVFTVFRMLLVDDYGYDGDMKNMSVAHPDSDTTTLKPQIGWTDFLVSYWLIMGAIIILNLFIALMSDTFQRVYDNAVEVALLERATIICSIEQGLPGNRKRNFLRYLQESCAPLECYYDDDEDQDEDHEVKKYTEQTFETVKGMQADLSSWKEDLVKEFTTTMSRQNEAQQRQISSLQQTVQHLTRVLEAQSKFTAPLETPQDTERTRSMSRMRRKRNQ